MPTELRTTLDALGAGSGVPDGLGYSWTPRVGVRGQRVTMGLSDYLLGLTVPVYGTDRELAFATASLRTLDVRTDALLPTDRVPFPRSFWNAQVGGGYVGQLDGDRSWGATLNLGTASDRPFHSLAEATLTALAFLRVPTEGQDGWLFYVVSATNGQLGRNLPVPGVASEFHTDRLTAVVGFPFVTIDWRPAREWQLEFLYAAPTDVTARGTYHLPAGARLFAAFEWTNQVWFRADREGSHRQLFFYEKRASGGFGWLADERADFRLSGGYAFDRFFVESRGLGFRGRNRTDLGGAQFVAAQLELKF